MNWWFKAADLMPSSDSLPGPPAAHASPSTLIPDIPVTECVDFQGNACLGWDCSSRRGMGQHPSPMHPTVGLLLCEITPFPLSLHSGKIQ